MGGFLMTAILVFVVIVLFAVAGLTLSRLYKRATKETAFVRTGLGGQKVIKDGGALVVPVLHEILKVNMQTLRLVVRRGQESALITKDKLRVDVEAEFYVRVKPDSDAIAIAAQTLGERTMNPDGLKELIEGKFVDSLRSVAAGMDMNQLHENRIDFVQKVQTTLNEDLDKNGLELETVSLTGLDQTDSKYFNPNNAFDAEGLKKLTEITEQRRKERNEIEQSTRVSIEEKNLEADKRSLEIKQENEWARLDQEREIQNRQAQQEREISERKASETKAAELARISAQQETEAAEIAKQRTIKEAEIQREQAIDAARISKEKAVKLAEQERAIEIARKSEEESKARADAEKARAEAITAEQEALTAEATAIANRDKEIAVIKERAEAEKKAAGVLVEAEAQKTAAEDRAAAKLTEADAEKEAAARRADAEAYAISKRAAAMAEEYKVEAEGKEAINAAADKLPQAERELQKQLELIRNMASIVEAMGKPIEKIDSFRILNMGGHLPMLTNGGTTVTTGEDGKPVVNLANGGTLPQQVVDALMNYKISMPLLQNLADEIGVDLSSLSSAANSLGSAAGVAMDVTDDPEPTSGSELTSTSKSRKQSSNRKHDNRGSKKSTSGSGPQAA